MRGKPFAACYKINCLIRNQIRLNRGNTIPLNAFYLIQGSDQIDECLTRCLSEVSDIYSCQNNLFSSLGSNIFRLFYQTFY